MRLQTRIENTDLSNRAKNQLIKNNVVNLEQLHNLETEDLLRISNLGEKSINEIISLKVKLEESNVVTLPNNYYIDDVLKERLENFLVNKEMVNILKLNNIQLLNTFIELTPEDIGKFRALDKEQKKKLWKSVCQTKKELGLLNRDVFHQVLSEPSKTIFENITHCVPNVRQKVKIKFLFKNRVSDVIDLGEMKREFSTREFNFIKKEKINSIENFLNVHLKSLYMIKGISKKSTDNIIKWLCNHIFVFSDSEVFLGQPLQVFLKKRKLGFLLDDKSIEVLLILNKFIKVMNGVGDIEKYSLRYTLDYLEENLTTKNIDLSNKEKDLIVFSLIQDEGGITREKIHESLNFLKKISIDEVIFKLEKSKKIESLDGQLICKRPSVLDYIKEVFNENIYKAFSERVAGRTLEDIGQEMGVTRERVRQLSLKAITNLYGMFVEDENAYWFTNYSFSKNDFEEVFCDKSYDYLSLRYKLGDKDISEVLEDERATMELKLAIRKLTNKNKLVIGDKIIPKNQTSIFKFVMEEFVSNATHIDDIKELLDLFLEEQQFDKDMFSFSKLYLENAINDSKYAVTRGRKVYRYYNFERYDWEEFYERLNIIEWNNKEISAQALYNLHNPLMDEYNIKHENELHNIIKKTHKDYLDEKIKVNRMPGISVGNSNREEQVKEFMIDNAPISVEDFVEKYNETYGVKKATIKANYLKFIESYIYNDKINVRFEGISDKEIEDVNNVLKNQDFVFIEDVKGKLSSIVSKDKLSNILSKLGYKRFTSYLLSSRFQSVREYFNFKFIEGKDIVDFIDLDKRIWNLSSFNSWLYDQVEELELVEFQYKKYITSKRLNEIGISKELLLDYRKSAVEKMNNGHIWTVTTLMDILKSPKLDELGFEPIFYRSIIRGGEKIYSVKVSNNYLLNIGEVPSVYKLIEEEILKNKAVDIYELMQIINDKYDLNLLKHNIISMINESDLYYDSIMEKVYLDLNYFYEELE